jgi:hypothetical protein
VFDEFTIDQWDSFFMWELQDHIDGNFYHAPIDSLVFHAATYSNRQAELLLRREKDALERHWKDNMDTQNREHVRKRQVAEERHTKEMSKAQKKTHEMKDSGQPYDSSLL